jgi:hypothetical protein
MASARLGLQGLPNADIKPREKVRFLAVAIAAIAVTGCGTDRCKAGTAFLTYSLGAGAAAADTVDVALSIGGAPAQTMTVSRKTRASSGSIEVDFSSYPTGRSLTFTLTARVGTQVLASATQMTTAMAGCTSLSFTLSAATNDLAGATVNDLSMADLSMTVAGAADLATPLDMPESTTDDMSMKAMADLAALPDLRQVLYPLTVNNTLAWCDVTVTINGHATEFKTQSSMTFMAADTTTVMLSAVPNPGFFAVKWTGVTTMSGSSATYKMTTGNGQSVTACCPTTSGGSGC